LHVSQTNLPFHIVDSDNNLHHYGAFEKYGFQGEWHFRKHSHFIFLIELFTILISSIKSALFISHFFSNRLMNASCVIVLHEVALQKEQGGGVDLPL
jgi:hypothetical protein